MAETLTNREIAIDERPAIIQRIHDLANVCVMIATAEYSETATRRELFEAGDSEAAESLPRIEEFNRDLKHLIEESGFTDDDQAILSAQNRTSHAAKSVFELAKSGVTNDLTPRDPYVEVSTETLRQFVEKVEKIKEILFAKYEDLL